MLRHLQANSIDWRVGKFICTGIVNTFHYGFFSEILRYTCSTICNFKTFFSAPVDFKIIHFNWHIQYWNLNRHINSETENSIGKNKYMTFMLFVCIYSIKIVNLNCILIFQYKGHYCIKLWKFMGREYPPHAHLKSSSLLVNIVVFQKLAASAFIQWSDACINLIWSFKVASCTQK